MSDDDKLEAAIREAVGPDLAVGYVLMVKTAVSDDADATGYHHYWSGDIDTRLGLLRIATMRTENAYMTETEDQ